MSRGDPQVKIRLPGDLRARVKVQAARNRRSMNAEIVLMIEAGLESTPSDLSSCSGQTEKEAPCQR